MGESTDRMPADRRATAGDMAEAQRRFRFAVAAFMLMLATLSALIAILLLPELDLF